MAGYAVRLPLVMDENDGAYGLLKSYKEVVQQNLKCLCLTAPGERMMDTFFGVGLKNFFFENLTPSIYPEIRANIAKQVARYMPFLQILAVNFNAPEADNGSDDHLLYIQIVYKIIPLGTKDELTILQNIPMQ